jgi:hypothetical protein
MRRWRQSSKEGVSFVIEGLLNSEDEGYHYGSDFRKQDACKAYRKTSRAVRDILVLLYLAGDVHDGHYTERAIRNDWLEVVAAELRWQLWMARDTVHDARAYGYRGSLDECFACIRALRLLAWFAAQEATRDTGDDVTRRGCVPGRRGRADNLVKCA